MRISLVLALLTACRGASTGSATSARSAKLDCPDAFDNDAATCRSWDPDLGATYQLLRDRGRVYVLAIDARTEAVAVP